MKTITRADWGLQLEAFARTIAPMIAAAWLAVLLTRDALEWLRRLACGQSNYLEFPDSSPPPPNQEEIGSPLGDPTPIRIPAGELLAAGGLETAEIEAILTPPAAAPAAAPRKRSKRSTRGRAVRSS